MRAPSDGEARDTYLRQGYPEFVRSFMCLPPVQKSKQKAQHPVPHHAQQRDPLALKAAKPAAATVISYRLLRRPNPFVRIPEGLKDTLSRYGARWSTGRNGWTIPTDKCTLLAREQPGFMTHLVVLDELGQPLLPSTKETSCPN